MATDDADRCRALTASGERCSRPAQEDGFCYQHDESDETVDDESVGDESDETAGSVGDDTPDPASVESDGGQQIEEGSETDGDSEAETDGDSETESDGGSGAASEEGSTGEGRPGVLSIRDSAASMVPRLIGRELDGVIEVTAHDGGWEVIVEVVERSSVPDTQDILGRYEITLEDPDTVTGYRRVDTYRRSGSGRDETSM